MVGCKSIPLLRMVPLLQTKEKITHHTFDTPYHHPVKKTAFQSIEVGLNTEEGEWLPWLLMLLYTLPYISNVWNSIAKYMDIGTLSCQVYDG